MSALVHRVRRGLAWSSASNLLLRVGSLAVGIVLARLLAPDQFGVYAVALTVQSILMTLADPGLTALLIRSEEHARLAPTTATIGMLCGAGLAAIMAAASPLIASVMGAPSAAPIIALLSLTLALAGAGVVPLATLQRSFAQQKVFAASAADFAVSTAATLLLVLGGAGPIALAVGRVLGQTVSTSLQFVLAKERPAFGWDRRQLGLLVSFGAPLAGANLVSWIVINLDNVVIARMLGPTALGFYVLAFNIASWPMNALGQAVRAVALPGFAQSEDAPRALREAVALTWAGAAGAGALLAALAVPLIAVVYGDVWLPAAPVLAALAVFGAMRAVFDLFAGYLMARGRSGSVLAVQVVWGVVLVPALVVGIRLSGVAGAGWAHVIVGAAVLGAYGVVLRGARVGQMLGTSVYPSLVGLAAGAAAFGASAVLPGSIARLVGGGAAGLIVLGAALWPWAASRLRTGAALSPAKREEPLVEEKP
ncbi:oligosaccharide flippase family protein [Sinomonas sp. ASV322]|uniref:oligosaccharide flippase family protein n=1 Tax=Sinomonas sp. ASV322 TaxID=3041920 RepID=UPI0027DDC5D5|nr:oligosaccharide flippase family protein [Sinomonas sp. ASV322]MDQ4504338.1 oligosaccharide flippase family protein [Sinomonas sp. ASV322]